MFGLLSAGRRLRCRGAAVAAGLVTASRRFLAAAIVPPVQNELPVGVTEARQRRQSMARERRLGVSTVGAGSRSSFCFCLLQGLLLLRARFF